jgi:hypothetical protein
LGLSQTETLAKRLGIDAILRAHSISFHFVKHRRGRDTDADADADAVAIAIAIEPTST